MYKKLSVTFPHFLNGTIKERRLAMGRIEPTGVTTLDRQKVSSKLPNMDNDNDTQS